MIPSVRNRRGIGGRNSRSTRAATLLVAALASISIVACGSTDATSGTETAPGSPVNATVPKLLEFTAPLVGGGEFDGTSVVGRPVAFWFWAPT